MNLIKLNAKEITDNITNKSIDKRERYDEHYHLNKS